MNFANIYVKPAETSFEDFSQQVFEKLRISDVETRGFPNQDPRVAYTGSAAGIEFSVWETEETEYPFCVSLELAGSSRAAEYLLEHAHFLAYQWSRDGWRCRVPEGQITFGQRRKEMVYAP